MKWGSTFTPCRTRPWNCARRSGTADHLFLRQHARVAEGEKVAIDEAFAAVVPQPMAVHPRHMAARGFEHRLSGSRIPLRSGSETRIQFRLALGDQAEFQGTPHARDDMRRQARQVLRRLWA